MKPNITKPHIATPAGFLAATAVSEGSLYSQNYLNASFHKNRRLGSHRNYLRIITRSLTPRYRHNDYSINLFYPRNQPRRCLEPVELGEEFENKITTLVHNMFEMPVFSRIGKFRQVLIIFKTRLKKSSLMTRVPYRIVVFNILIVFRGSRYRISSKCIPR